MSERDGLSRAPMPRRWSSGGLVLAALLLATQAQAGDAGLPTDAGVVDAGKEAGAVDPTVEALRNETSEVRDLVADRLAVDVPPTSLFEIPIDDDAAVALEAARLRALLGGVDAGAADVQRGKATSHTTAADAGGAAASLPPVPADVWAARVDLDRARLSFYELPPSHRRELLAAHAERQKASPVPSDIDQRAADAEASRQLALKAAREARTEAERLVATEEAALLEVDHAQVLFDQDLREQRERMATRREEVLAWQRRAHDAASSSAADADRTYDDLRVALRAARDSLSSALDDWSAPTSGVPRPPPDSIGNLQIDVDTSAARAERAHVESEAARLADEESKLRADRASQLLAEIDTLNAERLGLLDALSFEKRTAITGFTEAGLDQASSEVRQLTLILRYHKHAIADFVVSLRHPSRTLLGRTLAGSVFTILEWLAVLGGFLWARRRSPLLLHAWRKRAIEHDRQERSPTPGLEARALGFFVQIHRPVEWLLLLLLLAWLLPIEIQEILEVRLFATVVTWTVGASLVVDAINALAGGAHGRVEAEDGIDVAKLRLRSLRLVGRVVVLFGLVLVISAMLVGHGTIYRWVFSTCWLASLPILLVIVEWWKKVVFHRLESVRKKSSFQKWVLANATGWTSFVAATAGGVHLFVSGTIRAIRTWVGRFDVYRRVLAYLFRREMDKLVADRDPGLAEGLPEPAFRELGPETSSKAWIDTDARDEIASLVDRIARRRGGVIAIVGARGMGKSRTLEELHARSSDAVRTHLPPEGLDALRLELSRHAGTSPGASLDDVAARLDASKASAILVDDVQRLVRPVMGGLTDFDAFLAAASAHAERTTWVLAIDSVIWQFLERSRGARPLFDEVVRLRSWRETEIVELLAARTQQAGITPSFEGLLDPLPRNADEIDKREALEKRAADYYRLLWDHASGNPGIVLHVWRRSLGVDAEGNTSVRLFQALDTADLERLPDHAVFVLRAILQLTPAAPDEIAKATLVRPAEVADSLRYGEARGYIEQTQGRYRVTWTWFRAVSLFLQRRHLLGSSR